MEGESAEHADPHGVDAPQQGGDRREADEAPSRVSDHPGGDVGGGASAGDETGREDQHPAAVAQFPLRPLDERDAEIPATQPAGHWTYATSEVVGWHVP